MKVSTNNDVRRTLLDELAHARKGQAYYQKQVVKLSKQLQKLGVDPSGRGRRDLNIPATPSEFWVGLLGKRPKTHQQVLDATVKALKLDDPSPETLRKLRLRWSVMLIELIKKKRIAAEGAGRDRRFSLPEARTDKPIAS